MNVIYRIFLLPVVLLPLVCLPAQGQTTSYHIGNSLTTDGVTYTPGNVTGLQALASLYGFQHEVGYHIDAGQSLGPIWDHPENVDLTLSPYNGFDHALSNYAWDYVLLEPAAGNTSTFGSDKIHVQNFIDLTRSNSTNASTIFYIYQVWPKQSQGDFIENWEGPSLGYEVSPTKPRRQYYEHLMNYLTATNLELGNVVREVPVGEVLYELARQINEGSLPGITSFSELYRDDVHFNTIGKYIVSSTIAATIFKYNIRGTTPPSEFYDISPDLLSAINDTVWDVVSRGRHSGLGDFNDDGLVDELDFAEWSASYGVDGQADADGDGDSDGQDFLVWQRQYVQRSGAMNLTISSIPEPSGVIVATGFFLVFLFACRRVL